MTDPKVIERWIHLFLAGEGGYEGYGDPSICFDSPEALEEFVRELAQFLSTQLRGMQTQEAKP